VTETIEVLTKENETLRFRNK